MTTPHRSPLHPHTPPRAAGSPPRPRRAFPCAVVIFLTGIVSLILMRTLRKDYAKYARETADLDELDQELDESGWKQVRRIATARAHAPC